MRVRLVVATVLVGLAVHGIPGSSSQAQTRSDIPLTEGDIIELTVIGVPELSQRVQVDANGQIALPLAGERRAAGLTEAELRQGVQEDYEKVVLRRTDSSGRESQHGIAAQEVYLRVVEHAPIYVSGLVGRPGTVAYRPGLTVRQALAMAGGIGSPNTERPSLSNLLELRTQARLTRLDLSVELARDWTIRNVLALANGDQQASSRIAGDEAIWQAEQEKLQVITSSHEARLQRLKEAIAFADQRITALVSQQEGEEAGAALDSAEVEKANDLYRRGLVSSTRVTEVRRSALLAASRALQTSVAAADARRQKQDLEAQLQKLSEDFRIDLLKDLTAATARILTLREQVQAIEARLTMFGHPMRGNGQLEVNYDLVLYRRNGTETGQRIDSNATLRPGDTVEVKSAEDAS